MKRGEGDDEMNKPIEIKSETTTNQSLPASRAERRALGKQLREKCSRALHAEWKPRSRTHNPIELLDQSNADRIPGLIKIRYGRMSESPFAFFRGTAVIQARDLAASPVSGITVQACGDCHLMNFGGFATPERSLVFDINDFDETFPAPWEWDLKRLVASFAVAARHMTFSEAAAENAVRAAVASYREHMAEYADSKTLDVWYTQIKIEDLLKYFRKDKDAIDRLNKAATKARSRGSEAVFPKLTTVINGQRKIADNPPLMYHYQQTQQPGWEKQQEEYMRQYKESVQADRHALIDRYHRVDTVLKVVGVGSVGTRCFVNLFLADDDDPLFLQTKEARRSVLENPKGKSRYAHQGERVVTGQRLMQAASDIFLGWVRVPDGREYYVRQLRDMKVGAEIETFRPQTLAAYATMCGWALARAHAKAGDPAMIAGYVGNSERLDDALALYAKAYADQVERDFAAFKKAIRTGHLKTDTDETGGLAFAL
jgi:uncharacterized protein (DUF2252 family)